MKVQNEGTAKGDVIGAEEGQRGVSSFWGGPQKKALGNIFKVGDRIHALSNSDKVLLLLREFLILRYPLNQVLIVPHEALEKNLKLPFEVLFRSMVHLLVDTVSSEYEFGRFIAPSVNT